MTPAEGRVHRGWSIEVDTLDVFPLHVVRPLAAVDEDLDRGFIKPEERDALLAYLRRL